MNANAIGNRVVPGLLACMSCMWGLVGCGSAPGGADGAGEKLGSATLAMVNAPLDARCAQVSIVGAATEVRSFRLTPTQPAVFNLDGLPTGPVTFSERVFTQACAAVGTNDPKWESDAVDAELEPGVGVDVRLTLHLFGETPSATIHTDFPDSSPTFSTMTLPDGGVYRMTTGSDDNVWAIDYSASLATYVVERITPSGVVTVFPITPAAAAITAGPDGNLWVGAYGGKVLRVTTTGVVTEFSDGASPFNRGAPGPDGNVWFSEYSGNRVCRVSTGGTFTSFALPAGAGPFAITIGGDGKLWVSEDSANKIARVSTAGVVTEFTPPTLGSFTGGMTPGPDGNVWFTQPINQKVSRITPGGSIKEFSTPSQSYPYAIAAGADGNLWTTGNGLLTRVTPSGVMTEVALPVYAFDVITGPDGLLWLNTNPGFLRLNPSDVP